jgi:hypothetical protein
LQLKKQMCSQFTCSHCHLKLSKKIFKIHRANKLCYFVAE